MRYSGLIKNDLSAAPGVSVTFFTQGCPHRCLGCHNPETWEFDGGKEFTPQVLEEIYSALGANGIERSFCVMGGEPLCQENQFLTMLVLKGSREVPQGQGLFVDWIYFGRIGKASQHSHCPDFGDGRRTSRWSLHRRFARYHPSSAR